MTLQEIKDLKDKIYEIEGLLELAQLREDKIPELEPLILARLNALGSEDSSEDSLAKENAVREEPVIPEPETLIEESAEEEEVDEEMDSEPLYEEPESAELVEPQPEPEDEVEAEAAKVPTGTFTELFEESESVSVSRPADDLEIPVIKEEPAPAAPKPVHSGKPAFTLNDRFRFRRELFSNSDAEHSAAMDLIASMENYEEAEEYFLDELGWSLENPEVKDFMDIIQKYFA